MDHPFLISRRSSVSEWGWRGLCQGDAGHLSPVHRHRRGRDYGRRGCFHEVFPLQSHPSPVPLQSHAISPEHVGRLRLLQAMFAEVPTRPITTLHYPITLHYTITLQYHILRQFRRRSARVVISIEGLLLSSLLSPNPSLIFSVRAFVCVCVCVCLFICSQRVL